MALTIKAVPPLQTPPLEHGQWTRYWLIFWSQFDAAMASITNGITQLTGDVTAGPGSGSQVATIPNDTVTYAKMQNVSAASRLLGRGSAAGAGDVQEIALGSGLSMSGTTLSASGSGGTVTTTGSPTTGVLTKFSGATSITDADAAAVSAALDLLGT